MKKLIAIALAAAAMLCATSCAEQSSLTLSPSEITVKVGETQALHPGTVNLDIEFKNLVRIITDDGIAYFDSYYVVTGLKAGTTRVGIGIREDPESETSPFKYTAYTTVHVTE